MTASVVLPTYNERDVIVGVVGEILDAVGDVEVLVVDDDSPDRTWEAVETAFAGDRRARALRRVGRRGLPSAIAEGIAGTRGDVVVWLDADGSMPADVIPTLVAATADADVAVASRYAAGGRDARDSAARILASRAINAFGTLALGGPVRDWTSGFVAARRSALERVPIRADHVYGDYCIDFLHRACRQGLRVVEVPYACVERRAGTTKTSPSLRRFAALGFRYAQTIRRLRRESRTEEDRPLIEETRLPENIMAELSKIVPGPEPALEVRLPRIPVVEEALTRRIIPVSDPRLDGNELRYLTQCIQSNWISSAGRFVREFEDAFAQMMGCRYGVACSNGTTSLHLALVTFGLGPGDEVVLPAFTMIATANAVRYTGATPVLVDSERDTWNPDTSRLESAITPRTKGIIVVHTYGHPVDMDPVMELAERRGLWVLEDAAEAHGATYRGRPVGSIGQAASFSFYANKIITTGEGGMVTTNDPEIARLGRRLRDHAFSDERHFWHKYLGFNYRMTNMQAAVGLAQTERLEEFVRIRRDNAARYSARLKRIPGLTLPVERPWAKNVYWMYGVVVEDAFGISRDELRQRLARRGIETRTFFIPIHLQPIYYELFRGQRFPVAEELCQRGLYLPSGATLTEAEVAYVCQAVAEVREERG